MADKPRIAHLAGANATIQNTPPLVTSNKARAQHGLKPMTGPDGKPPRFDVLRPQRLRNLLAANAASVRETAALDCRVEHRKPPVERFKFGVLSASHS